MAADRRRLTRRPRAAGFTLLEVMVALAVLAFAFVALLGLQARNVQWIARDQDVTRATLLAREITSQIQMDALLNGVQGLGDSSGAIDAYPGFAYEQHVTSTGLDEMREVEVRILRGADPLADVVFFVRDTAV